MELFIIKALATQLNVSSHLQGVPTHESRWRSSDRMQRRGRMRSALTFAGMDKMSAFKWALKAQRAGIY